MTDEQLANWFAILDSGLSHAVLNRLLMDFGEPGALLGAGDSEWCRRSQLTPDQCRKLRESARDEARRKRQVESCHARQMALVPKTDDAYPVRLRKTTVPPPAVFLRGSLEEEDRLSVAIVGPRLATPYGLEVSRRLSRELCGFLTIVSGLAPGVDTAAHQATLEAGGRTIGVSACSLDQNYPRGNEAVREAIPEGGALLSVYPPLTKPARHYFPQRNYVMAGLSLAVVVVEASEKSGALLTARAACEEGREVFAVPGDITRRNSAGSNALLRDGARLLTSSEDLLTELEKTLSDELETLRRRRGRTGAPESPGTPRESSLSPHEKALWDAICHVEQSYEALLSRFVPDEMNLGEMASSLLQLELKGLVRQLPGKVYMPR